MRQGITKRRTEHGEQWDRLQPHRATQRHHIAYGCTHLPYDQNQQQGPALPPNIPRPGFTAPFAAVAPQDRRKRVSPGERPSVRLLEEQVHRGLERSVARPHKKTHVSRDAGHHTACVGSVAQNAKGGLMDSGATLRGEFPLGGRFFRRSRRLSLALPFERDRPCGTTLRK